MLEEEAREVATKKKKTFYLHISWVLLCVILLTALFITETVKKENAQTHYENALNSVEESNIKQALAEIKKSKELYSHKKKNKAYELEYMIAQSTSEEFLLETLAELSPGDARLLAKGKLQETYIEHERLNKEFTSRLKENISNRRYAKKEQKLKVVRKQFSEVDGSHIQLTEDLKNFWLWNSSSYEHVKTSYYVLGETLYIKALIKAEDEHGKILETSIWAESQIDGENLLVFYSDIIDWEKGIH